MGARKERKVFFYRDSEGAFETESVSRGGSSWSPWREGARRQVSLLIFLIGIQRGRLAPKVRSGEARFGLELDGGKAWRGRLPGALEGGRKYGVEGTKCRERRAQWAVKTGPGATSGTVALDQIRNTWGKAAAAPGVPSQDGRKKGKKSFIFWIQRGRLAPKVRAGEACCGFEVDGGKAWRGRLAGALEGGSEYDVEGTKCRERRASGEGVSEVVYVGRQESGSLRHAMVGGPVPAAEITAKPQWAVKTGPGATSGTLVLDQIRNTWGKAVAALGGVRS